MKFAILGAGAMGSLFGARLATGGHDVCLVDVDDAQIAAINANGITIESPAGLERVPVRAGRADDFSGPQDALIIFTKGMHTDAAIVSANHLIGEETRVLTAQNGLGNAEKIAHHVSFDRVVIGTTSYAGGLKAPGHLVLHDGGNVRIWSATGRADPAVARIAAAMAVSGLDCEADPQVERAIWEKVAFNAAINSLCSVTRYRVGELGDVPAGQVLARRIVQEVITVARARGVAADEERVNGLLDQAFAQHREHHPSMARDILEGRPTEIESINGAVVAEARRLGVPASTTETLWLMVRLTERSASTDG